MARKVASKEEATEAAPDQQSDTPKQKGVWFIKNQLNEIVLLDNEQTYQFTKARECFFDPNMIEQLRKAAKRHNIIEVKPEE